VPKRRIEAKELSARLRADTGRGAWVTAVAVIWGHFPAGQIEHENVVYIRGDRVADWLDATTPEHRKTTSHP